MFCSRQSCYCCLDPSYFPTFPPTEEKSLGGRQLPLDVDCSSPQEAGRAVCSSWATAGDLGEFRCFKVSSVAAVNEQSCQSDSEASCSITLSWV